MDLKAQFGEIIDKLRRQKPVIHHITNYVTAESCADIALAAGASPVMADEPEEVEEITCNADALVLNFGTFSFNKMIAMEKAVIMAKEAGIPVILDPVGVMSSSMRLQFALKLLENRYISIAPMNEKEMVCFASSNVMSVIGLCIRYVPSVLGVCRRAAGAMRP
ncbi:MAG: hydroxyethylthiazole kinase, partial [Phascolarctobacterium sp.]|nr:hydroxyethylthiazole kinase [Phascolarctobacterium sp.]